MKTEWFCRRSNIYWNPRRLELIDAVKWILFAAISIAIVWCLYRPLATNAIIIIQRGYGFAKKIHPDNWYRYSNGQSKSYLSGANGWSNWIDRRILPTSYRCHPELITDDTIIRILLIVYGDLFSTALDHSKTLRFNKLSICDWSIILVSFWILIHFIGFSHEEHHFHRVHDHNSVCIDDKINEENLKNDSITKILIHDESYIFHFHLKLRSSIS